jgi:hypothetical protein
MPKHGLSFKHLLGSQGTGAGAGGGGGRGGAQRNEQSKDVNQLLAGSRVAAASVSRANEPIYNAEAGPSSPWDDVSSRREVPPHTHTHKWLNGEYVHP